MKQFLTFGASIALLSTTVLATSVPNLHQVLNYAKRQVSSPPSPASSPEKRYAELTARQARVSITNTSDSSPTFSYDQLYRLQTRFLDAFMYPANQGEAQTINSTLFAENVQGRVDITRTFDGRELNTEYIFGLFANLANSTGFTLLGVPQSYQILQFAASQNIASATTRIMFLFPALKKEVPLIIETWNAFNIKGEIEMYDATFKHWTWAFDSFVAALATAAGTNLTQTARNISLSLAQSICKSHTQYCQGTQNQEYASPESCLAYLTDPQKVRLGASYELGRNTLLCRMVHQGMVALRPETHCPHIGPQGGGMCADDQQYADVVMQNYFTNAAWVTPPVGVAANANGFRANVTGFSTPS